MKKKTLAIPPVLIGIGLLFSFMSPEQIKAIKETIVALKDSGFFDNMDAPGIQTVIIYVLLIVVAALCVRLFIVNGIAKKIVDFYTKGQEINMKSLEHLETMSGRIQDLKNMNKEEQRKLADLLNILGAKRKTDYVDPQYLDTKKFMPKE